MERTEIDAAAPVAEKPKMSKKKKGWIIAACIIAGLVVIGIIAGVSGGNSEVTEKDNKVSTQTTQNTNQINYAEKQMNEVFELDGLEYQILNYDYKQFAYKGAYEAADGRIWLIVNAKITNNSANYVSLDVIDKAVLVVGEEEAEYTSKYYNYSEWIHSRSSLVPFESIEGMLMYSIPTSAISRGRIELRLKKNDKKVKNGIVIKLN